MEYGYFLDQLVQQQATHLFFPNQIVPTSKFPSNNLDFLNQLTDLMVSFVQQTKIDKFLNFLHFHFKLKQFNDFAQEWIKVNETCLETKILFGVVTTEMDMEIIDQYFKLKNAITKNIPNLCLDNIMVSPLDFQFLISQIFSKEFQQEDVLSEVRNHCYQLFKQDKLEASLFMNVALFKYWILNKQSNVGGIQLKQLTPMTQQQPSYKLSLNNQTAYSGQTNTLNLNNQNNQLNQINQNQNPNIKLATGDSLSNSFINNIATPTQSNTRVQQQPIYNNNINNNNNYNNNNTINNNNNIPNNPNFFKLSTIGNGINTQQYNNSPARSIQTQNNEQGDLVANLQAQKQITKNLLDEATSLLLVIHHSNNVQQILTSPIYNKITNIHNQSIPVINEEGAVDKQINTLHFQNKPLSPYRSNQTINTINFQPQQNLQRGNNTSKSPSQWNQIPTINNRPQQTTINQKPMQTMANSRPGPPSNQVLNQKLSISPSPQQIRSTNNLRPGQQSINSIPTIRQLGPQQPQQPQRMSMNQLPQNQIPTMRNMASMNQSPSRTTMNQQNQQLRGYQ